MPNPNAKPSKPLTSRTLLTFLGVPAYVLLTLILFFTWVNPSLVGETENHIAADSSTYMKFAESLREGRNDPYVLASLYSFPNTLWGPVLFAFVLNSTVAIVLANYLLLFIAIWLLKRATLLDVNLFLLLLFANVTTFISLVSVNKEIIDLFTSSLFIYYLGRRNRFVLALALVIALVSRYETCVVMLLYLGLRSRLIRTRLSRPTILFIIVLALSVLLSAFLSGSMHARMEEVLMSASSGGILLLLDNLQMHFLFVLAVVPKVLDNLFSELINIPHWETYSLDDPANTFFLLGNNIANLFLISFVFLRGRLTLRNNLIYYAALSAIFMSLALVIQPRYFYGPYVVLCVEAARMQRYPLPQPVLRDLHA